MRLQLKLVTQMFELEKRKPLYGLRLTWFHWSHNLRIYVGFLPQGWLCWLPRWRTYPYSLIASVRMRRLLTAR